MAISILDQIAEKIRQNVTGDKFYYEKKPYAFVLNGPEWEASLGWSKVGRGGGIATAVFPLPVNPEEIDYALPYAAEVTGLQEGGVVAEENGFVIGEITIQASTGWDLKKVYDTSWASASGQFTGGFAGNEDYKREVSGQFHFWRLANRCFEAYSDLKKDPANAPKTSLEFHSVKDDLHLLVIPRELRLTRTASRDRATYRYSVRCSVVGEAGSNIEIPGPEQGLLDQIKNSIAKVRQAVQGVKAAIDDITAAIGSLSRTIRSLSSIIDDATSIVNAADDLVSGVKSFFSIPKTFITSTAELIESGATLITNAAELPADVAQTLRQMSDEFDRLAVAVKKHLRDEFDAIADKYDATVRGFHRGRDPIRSKKMSTLSSEAAAAGGSMSVQRAFGSGIRPGDARRTQQGPPSRTRASTSRYTAFEERVVGQGDTIQSLAVRYLGDARRWMDLAILNSLSPPYISEEAKIPNTLSVGDRVVVPISRPTRAPDTLTGGEPTVGRSQMVQQLGQDYEVVKLSDYTYGWAVDESAGGVDGRQVVGTDNMAQATAMRLRTERGTNLLYPQIGLPRIIGRKAFGDALVDANYEARRQLLADPRVRRIQSMAFRADGDALSFEARVQLVGFSSSTTIARQLT